MKKEYKKPSIAAVKLEDKVSLMQSSYTDIGGKTDTFGARDMNEDWSEY